MTDVVNRAEIERKLARVLSKDLRNELDKLMGYLGDPPDLSRVPAEYWSNGWRGIQRDVEPILLDAFLSQAESLMLSVGIGANWDNVNRQAVNWARTYTEDFLCKLWETRNETVTDLVLRRTGEIIGEGYEQGLSIREITERLSHLYSPVRAEMIAVTETTRAVVEGERAFIAELERETGQQMIPIWLTANDERVCPICSPRNEKPITDGMYPPAHPRCRCGVGWEFPKETTSGMSDVDQDYKDTGPSVVDALNAKTGREFSGTLFRGIEPNIQDRINRTPSQYAVGEYWTPSRTVAETYGTQIIEQYTTIKNPYVFQLSGKDAYYNELIKEFGTRNPQEITNALLRKGYDGLIVKGVPFNRGEIGFDNTVEIILFKGSH